MFGEPCAQKLMIWSLPTLEATILEEPWCHPSSPWDAKEASSRLQSKKETALIIDTKHGSLLRSRHLRQSKNHGDRPLVSCYSLVNQWWWPWSQGCTTRCSEDHKIKIIDIFGSIRKKSLLSSIFCSTSEANSSIFLDIQKLHEVPVPTNQKQVNRRFLQAGMAKTLKVVHSENFWTARSAKSETGITLSFRFGLRWMTTCWKGNFINISIDLYFGICSIMDAGENPRRRGRSNAMRTR